jgi:pyrroline-5-carboxylate reductase
VGVLGAGRLGRALAARLRPHAKVALCDADPRKAKQAAKQLGAEWYTEAEILRFSEILLLCIPAAEVERFFRRVDTEWEGPHPLYLNTATDLDTPPLVRELGLRRCRVIGLKPIGQFATIARGVPVTFVTAHDAPAELAWVRRLCEPLGPVRVGDEHRVGLLNRAATRLALRFCLSFREELAELGDDAGWTDSALRGVVAGTLLDYPPDRDNAYTAGILRELQEGTDGHAPAALAAAGR